MAPTPRSDIEKSVLVHGFLALTIALLLLAWGTLLSPPMKPLREALGMEELPGTRMVDGRFEIINPDKGEAFLFLGRVAHYYHSVFIVLLYGTLVLLVRAFQPSNHRGILALALLGTLMTVGGGITYAYFAREPQWHGLFIGGLAVMFAAAALAVASFRPKNLLGWAALAAGVLLMIGGVQGAYVGAYYMDEQASHEFREAVIDSRFDPDLAEENELWRAWTGHQHAMIAVALALAFITAFAFVELKEGRLARLSYLLLIPSTIIMALASYSVWKFGGGVHLLITPSALLLTTVTTLLSFMAKAGSPLTPRGALVWMLRLGNLSIWLFVSMPGAMTAMSLRKPTAFFDPAFRDPAWDWVELAFNIGHWHVLLTAWGVTLAVVAATMVVGGRLGTLSAWASFTGYTVAGLGFLLYVLKAQPGAYSLNPYDNTWVKALVEPGLTLLTLGLLLLLYGVARKAASLITTREPMVE